MDINKILDSRLFKGLLFGIMCFIILGFIFNLGLYVGTKRAEFSFKWADQYHRNFGGPQGGFFEEFIGPDNEFTNGNGVFGQIIKIDDGSLTVKGQDNTEKIILVTNKTTIVYQKKNIKLSDLKMGNSIVVIGAPNDNGQIKAELIRVMPNIPGNLKNMPNDIPATIK